jgi:hypothetical protein
MDKDKEQYFKNLLPAYEMGILSNKEREEFELHYFECGSCFEEVKEFEQVARLLRGDSEVYKTARAITRKHSAASFAEDIKRIWSNFRQYAFAKPVAIAVLILILIIPSYLLLRAPHEIQIMNLMAVRGGEYEALNLERGGEAEIHFVLTDAGPGRIYSVDINNFQGKTVYADSSFSGFNEKGQAIVTVPVDRFTPGFYKLRIFSSTGELLQEYPFKVE